MMRNGENLNRVADIAVYNCERKPPEVTLDEDSEAERSYSAEGIDRRCESPQAGPGGTDVRGRGAVLRSSQLAPHVPAPRPDGAGISLEARLDPPI